MAETVLRVEHVGMRFNLSKERVDSLKDYILKSITRQMKFDEFWALKDINFTLEKGERIGILGTNGAGKSTLLKVIAGVFKPTEGSVVHKGKIVPLLELGAGFDKEYTGRENIYLYGAVLGYSKEFIDSKFDEIVKFSGLKKFLDVPLKNYSSGMKSRLGFSIATIVEPEILILDEVLSVGDAKFRKKSEKKILSMMDKGVTVLFVSHSLEQVKRICTKAMILENAYFVLTPSKEVSQEKIDKYEQLVSTIHALPIILDYKEHDYITGTISHLPHIIAATLVNYVKDSDTKSELMKRLAAGGFKDITRIASSSPTMWQHICLKNKDNISQILASYIKYLEEVKSMIDSGDGQAIYDWFDSSRIYRNSLPGASSGPIKKAFEVYCDIIDEAGGIAAIATILASNGLSIKNIGIVHNREFEEGVLRIEFYDESSSKKAAELLQKFRYIVYER